MFDATDFCSELLFAYEGKDSQSCHSRNWKYLCNSFAQQHFSQHLAMFMPTKAHIKSLERDNISTKLSSICNHFIGISLRFFAQGSGKFYSTSGLLEVDRLAERFPRNFAVTHGWQWSENNYCSKFYSFDCVTRLTLGSHLKHSPQPHFHDHNLPPKHAPDCRQLRLWSAAGKYQRLTKLRECVLSCRLTKCSSQMWFILGYQLAGGFTQCISGGDW